MSADKGVFQEAARVKVRGMNTRTTNTTKFLLGVLVALVLACVAALVACSSHDEANASLEEATVERVVDGDTIIVDMDDDRYRVRFIGMDTPESVAPEEERNTKEGVLASDHTKEVLPAGTTVWLEKDVSDTDKYDRLLRYVWLECPTNPNDENEVKDKMLNAQLVADGWAKAKSYPPDTKWDNLFASLEP